MSNYHVEPIDKPQAITSQAIKSLRQHPVQGIPRRRLLRVSIGAAVALWLTELAAGTIGFLWPNLKGGFGGAVTIGKLDDVKRLNSSLPIAEGTLILDTSKITLGPLPIAVGQPGIIPPKSPIGCI